MKMFSYLFFVHHVLVCSLHVETSFAPFVQTIVDLLMCSKANRHIPHSWIMFYTVELNVMGSIADADRGIFQGLFQTEPFDVSSHFCLSFSLLVNWSRRFFLFSVVLGDFEKNKLPRMANEEIKIDVKDLCVKSITW